MRRLIALLVAWLVLAPALSAQPAGNETAERFTNPYAWIEGRWDVRYTDARRGEIVGSAIFTTSRYRPEVSTRGEILFPDEQTGGVYRLQLVSVEPLAPAGADGLVRKLRLTFSGKSPPSGDSPSGERLVIELAPGQRLEATVGEGSGLITTGPPPAPRSLLLELSAPDGRFDRVEGRWQRQVASEAEMMLDRAGSFTPQGEGGIVTGSETWSRFDSLPVTAQRLRGPTPDQLMAAAWRQARDQASREGRRFEPPESLGRMWLSVIGINLPVEAMRIRDIEIGPAPVEPGAAEAPQDQQTRADNFRNVRLLGVRRNPEDGRVLDLRLELLPDFNDGPIGITVNGKTVTWHPEIAPEKPRFVRFVRRNRGDFMPIDQIYPGEVVYIEASYARPPQESDLLYALGGFAGSETPVIRLSPAEEAPIGPGGLLAYRSERILVLDAQAPQADRDRFEAARETGLVSVPPFVLKAEIGAALSATPASRGRPVARARMAPPPPSLWQEALARARACRAAGGATGVSNIILTEILFGDGVVQTVPVSLEDHAAAILLRDELLRRVDQWIARAQHAAQAGSGNRRAALEREALALMRLADMKGAHPLLDQRVPTASWNPETRTMEWSGGEAPLREVLSRAWVEMLDKTATPENQARRRAVLENAMVQISRARGILQGYAPKTRKRLAEIDICDLRSLYSNVGVGTQQVVQSLIPRLVRTPTGDEPPYPAWVPDRVAIAAVQGVAGTMAAIAAQQEWARADTDFILTAATIPAMGLGTTAMAALDVAEVLRSALEAWEAVSALTDDVEYGIGLSTVAGDEYLRQARARGWERATSAALNLGAAGAGKAFEEVGEAAARGAGAVPDAPGGTAVRASLPEEAGEAIVAKALREGGENLTDAERRILLEDLNDLLPEPPTSAPDLAETARGTPGGETALDDTVRGTPEELAETLRNPLESGTPIGGERPRPNRPGDTVILENPPRNSDDLAQMPTERGDIYKPPGERAGLPGDGPGTPRGSADADAFVGTETAILPPPDLPPPAGPRGAGAAVEDGGTPRLARGGELSEGGSGRRAFQEAPTERIPGEASEAADPAAGVSSAVGAEDAADGAATARLPEPEFPPLADSRGAGAGADRLAGTGGEDLTDTVILSNPPREAADFIETLGPGRLAEGPAVQPPRAAPAGAPSGPVEATPIGEVPPGTPYRATILAPDGSPVELALEKRLGAGGYNEVFTLAGRDDAVARISLRPAEGPDLDEIGRRLIEEALPAGQPRTAAPIDIVRRIDDVPGIPGGRVERIESTDARLDGKTIEILERVREGSASAQIARQGGMTPGQAAAFDEGMRWLNRRGLVWLDNHPGNFAFRNLGGDDWQLLVLDPGGIVPATASDLGDAAATAAQVQRMLDSPPPEFRRAFDFGNMEMRWKLKREIIQEEVLPGRVDLEAVGIPSADLMPFYAASIEAFPELAHLRALDDAAAEQARAALKAREDLIPQVNPKTGEPVQ